MQHKKVKRGQLSAFEGQRQITVCKEGGKNEKGLYCED